MPVLVLVPIFQFMVRISLFNGSLYVIIKPFWLGFFFDSFVFQRRIFIKDFQKNVVQVFKIQVRIIV